MDKTGHTEFQRLFFVDQLPEPLSPSSAHLQIFDRYIPETRLRVRQVRDPYTNIRSRILQQLRYDQAATRRSVSDIFLDEVEYALFDSLDGLEIRKNRYFHEIVERTFVLDVYLGPLRGLCTAAIKFESVEECAEFEPPLFLGVELTDHARFRGAEIARSSIEDLRRELSQIFSEGPSQASPVHAAPEN